MSNTTLDLSSPIQEAYRHIAPCFGCSETRARSQRYLAGLLSTTERKNGWQLAEQSGELQPRGAQRLLDEAEWDADEVRACCYERWLGVGRVRDQRLFALVQPHLDGFELTQAEL